MPGMDDLTPLLNPSGDDPPLKAQGVIKAWNPDTFENVVQVHGRDLANLPVASSVEALTYQAGDTVILDRWPSSRGGTGTWWIAGRVVIPGTGRGEEAIAFMTTALGSAVARSVIGSSVFYDQVAPASIRTAFDTFGDLETLIGSNPSPGPEVSFTLSGDKFLAIWGAPNNATINSATETRSEGYMAVEVSGEASISPAVGQSSQITFSYPNVSGSLSTTSALAVAFMFDSLSPGDYTVTAKYRIDDQGTSALTNVAWQDRWLLVIAF